jgi:hypothetical protein
MVPFRWKNCLADVHTYNHARTVEAFLRDVILPAIEALDGRIDELGRSESPGAVFAQSDMEDVRRETKMSFALAIQSIWERQLRTYLQGCARDLGQTLNVEKANWKDLQTQFRTLRGIGLKMFPSFDDLEILHHLGNACRHGDGSSGRFLLKRCPDLWPLGYLEALAAFPHGPAKPSVSSMDVPLARLCASVEAVAAFWRDTEHIYKESIEPKDATLEASLVKDRQARRWLLTQAEGIGGAADRP